jgi:moderate conductance mechanosensitive channel
MPQWVETLLRVAAVLVAAVLLTGLSRVAIRRFTGGLVTVQGYGPFRRDDERRAQRTRSVGGALRSAAAGVIWTVAVLVMLDTANINITAFVAVTTVVGGAIGFGAQQVVRDILAGLFVLSEDHYGVGDLVDLGHASGTVERVTLRSTRLRDVEGRVWHVPNGQIVRAGNFSQEWSQALLDVPLALDVDPDEAIATIRSIAASVQHDPDVGSKVLAEPEILGVTEVFDDRYVVRVVVRTRPNDKHVVQRAVRLALLKALQADELSLAKAGPASIRLLPADEPPGSGPVRPPDPAAPRPD